MCWHLSRSRWRRRHRSRMNQGRRPPPPAGTRPDMGRSGGGAEPSFLEAVLMVELSGVRQTRRRAAWQTHEQTTPRRADTRLPVHAALGDTLARLQEQPEPVGGL